MSPGEKEERKIAKKTATGKSRKRNGFGHRGNIHKKQNTIGNPGEREKTKNKEGVTLGRFLRTTMV